jgi:glycosyltransferase involved in cell wall biosynthesis
MGQNTSTVPVSVIVPCYNCSNTLARAVTSVAAQTRRPEELILVDDSSTDGTRNVMERLQRELGGDWIQVVTLSANSGPGAARNAGWDAATQPWVAFLDADDAWHKGKLEIQWQWLEVHPEAALCGHLSIVAPEDPGFAVADHPAARRISVAQMLVSNRFPTRSVMLRRELPFRFRRMRNAEDYLLWLEIILSGRPAWCLEAPLACSFRHDFSAGGLSGQLWKHERAELDSFRILYREGKIGVLPYGLASGWSLLKFLRRVAIEWGRRWI